MNAILYGQIVVGVAGLAVGGALVWWLASWRHTRHVAKLAAAVAPSAPASVPAASAPPEPAQPDVKSVHDAEARYQAAIEQSAQKFAADLGATSQMINEQIKRLSADLISGELEQYRKDLDGLRQQAMTSMGQVSQAATEQRQAMQAAMEKEVEEEKQRRLAEFESKLNETVTSFLLETLKHNVDLGAQTPYLMAMLEEHKADLLAEVGQDV